MRSTVAVAIWVLLAFPALAQDARPSPEVRVRGELAQWWLDTKFPDSWSVAGASRFYLNRRIAIEPEYSYSQSRDPYYDEQRHSFTSNLVFPFGAGQRVRWYWFAGAGAGRWGEMTGVGRYWHSEFLAHAGVGADLDITRRVFLTPQVRLGRGPMIGFGLGIGFKTRP